MRLRFITFLKIVITIVDAKSLPSENFGASFLRTVGKILLNLIALALNLDDHFFEKIGAVHDPAAFIRLLHYPGNMAFQLHIANAMTITIVIVLN